MPTHPTYRPDIDGLRALAVLAVVIFHAFPVALPGGFIGVDVFFVISGFLITNIILKGLEQDSFSFTQFYAHRIRRIFPALILVLCACFAFGWFALLPVEYKQLGKHIAGSSAFVSNWMFWQEAGYFDNAADTKPLLHLWSLGIEEQFYIVWPVLVWGLFRWRLNILTFTIIALLASLAYSGVVIGRPDLVKDFYSPLTRFWELLIGALLAYGATTSTPRFVKLKTWLQDGLSLLVFDGPIQNAAQRMRQFGSIIGLLLFIGGLVLINQKTVFPGYWALLPTLGALCLIGAGPHAWINCHLLSNRLLVGIGLISYPLYLWHWPLLSFAKILEGETVSWKLKLLLVAVAVILSVATYWLIEKPIRFGKHQKVKTIILVLLMSIIGYVGYNTYVRDGLGFRFGSSYSELNKLLQADEYNYSNAYRHKSCFLDAILIQFPYSNCNDGVAKNKKILLWGDSHAAHLYPGLLNKYGEEFQIFQRTSSGCKPFVDDVSNPQCQSLNNSILLSIKDIRPTHIFLSGNWSSNDVEKLEVLINVIKEKGPIEIIIAGPSPVWDEIMPKVLFKYFEIEIPHQVASRLDSGFNKNLIELDNAMRKNLSKRNVKYISIKEILCNDSGCITKIGSNYPEDLIFWDHSHLTKSGSEYVVSKFPDLNLPH